LKRIIQRVLGKLGYRIVPVRFLGEVAELGEEAQRCRVETAECRAAFEHLARERDEARRERDDARRELAEVRPQLAGYKNAYEQVARDLGCYRAAYEGARKELEAATTPPIRRAA
jgi:uncharacterized coiled-coil DUF342 family protein